jgi:hypothetical protein
MAKNKKPASSSSSYGKKKAIPATSKKPVKKAVTKLDDKKVEIISEKLTKINKNFECLIAECQTALKQLSNVPAEV